MKRVYVVFEDCSDSWSTPGDYDYDQHNYGDKFIDVYDSFHGAAKSIDDWAESTKRVVNTVKERTSITIVTVPEEDLYATDPYYFKDKTLRITTRRYIKSVLVKSS